MIGSVVPSPTTYCGSSARPTGGSLCSTDLRGPNRKHGTPVSGWSRQLVSRIGVPDHAPSRDPLARSRRPYVAPRALGRSRGAGIDWGAMAPRRAPRCAPHRAPWHAERGGHGPNADVPVWSRASMVRYQHGHVPAWSDTSTVTCQHGHMPAWSRCGCSACGDADVEPPWAKHHSRMMGGCERERGQRRGCSLTIAFEARRWPRARTGRGVSSTSLAAGGSHRTSRLARPTAAGTLA